MQNMYEKRYELRGDRLIYHMPKEVDHHASKQLCKELDMLVDSFALKELELDFTETDFMDSSGIGVIIGRSKTMQFRTGKLTASHLGKRIEMVFHSAGLQRIVEIKEGK